MQEDLRKEYREAEALLKRLQLAVAGMEEGTKRFVTQGAILRQKKVIRDLATRLKLLKPKRFVGRMEAHDERVKDRNSRKDELSPSSRRPLQGGLPK